MVPPKYTLFQCIAKVFGIIGKYPFSIFLLALVIFSIFIIVYGKKLKSKAPKIIAVLSWIVVAIFMFVKYAKALTFIKQTMKSKTFTSIYFPNFIIYILMLLFSIYVFFRSIIKKEKSLVIRVINGIGFGVIWVNLILILREIFKNNITIYDPVTIYSHETLQVLIQTSMWVFVFWMLALIINYVSKFATKKLDKLSEKQAKQAANMNSNIK